MSTQGAGIILYTAFQNKTIDIWA